MANLVKTDAEAFRHICGRLQGDVGRLIQASTAIAQADGTAPFWALVRMLFPVAESLGDLMHQSEHSSDNLLKGIEALEGVRPGYKDKAAILALLYRHSLMHTDEMRSLNAGGKVVEWRLAFSEPADHLKVDRVDAKTVRITLDLTSFYDDLLAICQANTKNSFGGKAAARYNAWTEFDLDAKSKLSSTEKRARQEITALFTP